MPQLRFELGIGDKENEDKPRSLNDVAPAQKKILDAVCERYCLNRFHLAHLPDENIMGMIKAIFPKQDINPAILHNAILEYAVG